MVYPCSLTNFTAETLNSRVNFLRAMDAPSGRDYPALRRVHQTWGSPIRKHILVTGMTFREAIESLGEPDSESMDDPKAAAIGWWASGWHAQIRDGLVDLPLFSPSEN
jgi:hypothetical protein